MHRVYMTFFLQNGWYCQFLEADLKTPLPKKLTFKDERKIRELAERGRAFATQEGRHALNQEIANGRGGIYLELTEAQYRKLT